MAVDEHGGYPGGDEPVEPPAAPSGPAPGTQQVDPLAMALQLLSSATTDMLPLKRGTHTRDKIALAQALGTVALAQATRQHVAFLAAQHEQILANVQRNGGPSSIVIPGRN